MTLAMYMLDMIGCDVASCLAALKPTVMLKPFVNVHLHIFYNLCCFEFSILNYADSICIFLYFIYLSITFFLVYCIYFSFFSWGLCVCVMSLAERKKRISGCWQCVTV